MYVITNIFIYGQKSAICRSDSLTHTLNQPITNTLHTTYIHPPTPTHLNALSNQGVVFSLASACFWKSGDGRDSKKQIAYNIQYTHNHVKHCTVVFV